MSGEDPRRVADYFVVAGLPHENQQPLDEYGLEVSLKPTAYQDPITDITVIFPSLAENVPDYYQMVEMTPTGLSANLNHGSFRAQEVFLCYRRGRDRPPLLDIGIFYDGKEKVLPDSQVVEFSPNGHSANVNNTHNSSTFLTYRRANELSPCNELVVMDICVIVASKGEEPPHSFKKIDKTLNKGMVGADVFICYKKSINRPDLLSYKPSLLHRFPLKNNPTYKLENTVALFCLPMGATLECWPAETTRPPALSSTFVLTLASREKVYGSAITFYEEYDEELLTEAQETALNLQKYRRKTDRSVFANRCICLLSRWPFFEAFEEFLFFLHKVQLMGPYDVPLERFIAHFLYDVPFPSPERPRILVQLSPEEEIALFQPVELPLPRSGASFRNLLCNLGPDNCLLVLLLALTEQKLLFHSLRPSVLTSVAEAIIQIIFPFYWQCPYIPLCPIGMSDYLAAPLPFVVGLDSRFFDLYDQPSEVNAIDLDTNTVTLCDDKKTWNIKLLPKKASRALRTALVTLQEKCVLHNKLKHKLEAHNDGAIDFVFKMKHKEMLLEMEIREAFLHFMVSILQGYRQFLLPITSAPTVGATDVDNLFDSQGFLRSRDRNYHKFYGMLMRTQMFTKFIEERSFVSETNASLAFFDECMDRQTDHFGTDPVRFLEIEGSISDRTVFILPPDATDLPPGGIYKYKQFDDLNPDLFYEREDEDCVSGGQPTTAYEAGYQSYIHLARGGGPIFSTPVAALAKRTKQEIRSAQKSARKNAESPFTWAKCLVNTAYSLWYIHLPGFMLANNGKPQTLRVGLTLLHRMHKLKLHPADEICYRVMMQLCGVYDQPVLAVKVLFEMKAIGLVPNAVTYGYYNKAVLESEWPSGALSHSQLLWNKLRNVLFAIQLFKKMGKIAGNRPKTAPILPAAQLAVNVAMSGSKQSLTSKESEPDLNVKDKEDSASNQETLKEPVDILSETDQGRSSTRDKVNGETELPEEPKVVVEESDENVSMRQEVKVMDSKAEENDEEKFRKRLSSIVKPSPDSSVATAAQGPTSGAESSKNAKLESTIHESPNNTPKVTLSAGSPSRFPLGHTFPHKAYDQGVITVGDLKINQLGHDKEILEKLQQDPNNASNNKPNGNGIRDSYNYGKPATSQQPQSQGVNRVLFRSENEDDDRQDRNNEDGWKKERSVDSADSDEGLTFDSTINNDPLLNSPLGRPLPVLAESPVSKMNQLNLSPPSSVHKVASSASMKLMGVPVTENDPLGALVADSPTNSLSGLTKIQTTKASDYVEKASSPLSDDSEILGRPFADKYSMARSSTMPLDDSGRQVMTPGSGFASPSLALSLSSIKNLTKSGQSRLSSLKKSGYFGGWATSPSSKKAQEALTHGVSSIKYAYSSAATTLSKRVEEFREYQTPQKSMSPAVSSQYLSSRDEDTLSQDSTGSRRPSDVSGLPPLDNNTETWSYLTGQLWEQLWSGYTTASGDAMSKGDSSASHPTGGRSITELYEDVYSKMPKRPPGPVAMELQMTSCSRCLSCGCILYDEEIMAGWSAEDSNLNTKCQFCGRWVVPFLTIRVIDFRTRPLSVMATLLTPAPSVDSLSVAGSALSLQPSGKESVGSSLSLQPKAENDEEVGDKEIVVTEESQKPQHVTSHNRSASEGTASLATTTSSEGDDQQESENASSNSLSTVKQQNQRTSGTRSSDELEDPIISDHITVPYLSPLVLRKELENMLEREGDTCLINPDCVDDHPIIYWNLVWYFERIAVKSQIPGMCLKAKSLNSEENESSLRRSQHASSWASADHRNIFIRCKWDNERMHEENQPPIYTQWQNVDSHETEVSAKDGDTSWIAKLLSHQEQSGLRPLMEQIISGVQQNDLLQPIKSLLDERRKTCKSPEPGVEPPQQLQPPHAPYSIYREIMFLTLVAMSQDNIDLTAFDREYRRAFEKLPSKYVALLRPHDRPPDLASVLCRKLFRELRL